jgi:hypothetical protein
VEKVASVIDYYSEKIDLSEKIPVLIAILKIFPNSCLRPKKSFSHMPTSKDFLGVKHI